MTAPPPPLSPAGATTRVDAPRDGVRSLPRAPDRGEILGALLAGAPTVLFTTIVATALALRFTGQFVERGPLAITLVFVLVPGVGLAVFLRRWVLTLRTLVAHGVDGEAQGTTDAVRWPFLLVPFFLVVGAVCGVALALAVTRERDGPGAGVIARQCAQLLDQASASGAAVPHVRAADERRCAITGAGCAEELIARGDDSPDALRACVTERFAAHAAAPER